MPPEALGESCLLWPLGHGPSPANTRRVLDLQRRLRAAKQAGRIIFRDAVPAYDSLAVHFDPLTTDRTTLTSAVDALLSDAPPAADATDQGPLITLPTVYDGPDLQRVADHTRLAAADVAQRHTAPVYTVAAIGFLPHFPYLLGLDPRLITPRRASPRPRVPAGSVAIGGDQTGVYPQESPGGWHLIGTTDPAQLVTLKPGDRVRFEPVEPLP